jgi:hypothetical protein
MNKHTSLKQVMPSETLEECNGSYTNKHNYINYVALVRKQTIPT